MESEIVKLIEAETGMVITWDHNLGGENGEVLVKGFFGFFFFLVKGFKMLLLQDEQILEI